MADSIVQLQLNEVREILLKTRNLFGDNLIGIPADVLPDLPIVQRLTS